PDLVDHARQLAGRADWRFETVREIGIPERDAAADFVCFFSVFTHLDPADCYRYLAEASRVARPGGPLAFSFLEFAPARPPASFSPPPGPPPPATGRSSRRRSIPCVRRRSRRSHFCRAMRSRRG